MPREKLALDEQGRKKCPRCETYKHLSDFTPDSTHAFGVSSRCKVCSNKMMSERYSLDTYRAMHLQRTYGISVEEYEALLIKQRGVCASCGQTEKSRTGRTKRTEDNEIMLHVDHDHVTGKVRGLLCSECNKALGLLHDDTKRIEDLLRYAKGFN